MVESTRAMQLNIFSDALRMVLIQMTALVAITCFRPRCDKPYSILTSQSVDFEVFRHFSWYFITFKKLNENTKLRKVWVFVFGMIKELLKKKILIIFIIIINHFLFVQWTEIISPARLQLNYNIIFFSHF